MEDKNLEDIICCSVCLEVYNEGNRCPRILYCGHSYCHSCLDQLLINGHDCPTCKSSILFESTEIIPINFSLKNLISNYIFEGKIPVSDSNRPKEESYTRKEEVTYSPTYKSNLILEPKLRKFRSEGYCSLHDSFKELRCIDCDLWVCAMCVILYHKQGNCRTMLVEEYYKGQKKEIFDKIEKELQTRLTYDEEMSTAIKVLNKEKDTLIEEIKTKEKELEKRIDRISELESQKNNGNIFCNHLRHLRTVVEKSENEIEFSKAKTDINRLFEHGLGLNLNKINYTDQKLIYFPLTIDKLDRICYNEAVYAFEEQSQTLFGRVRVNLGRVWIESFEEIIPEGRLISYKELLLRFNRFYELPKRAFMRLSPLQGGPDVEIVIETDGKSLRAQNFVLLCSALRRQKYKGATLKTDSLFCQLVTGPVPVVDGIKKDMYVPVKEGVVVGTIEGNSWFAIAIKDFPKKDHQNHKIGNVVTGHKDLKELSGDMLVKECGLVL